MVVGGGSWVVDVWWGVFGKTYFHLLSNSHNSESYRLVRFGVELFDGRFGVGFEIAVKIYSESESESRVA